MSNRIMELNSSLLDMLGNAHNKHFNSLRHAIVASRSRMPRRLVKKLEHVNHCASFLRHFSQQYDTELMNELKECLEDGTEELSLVIARCKETETGNDASDDSTFVSSTGNVVDNCDEALCSDPESCFALAELVHSETDKNSEKEISASTFQIFTDHGDVDLDEISAIGSARDVAS